MMSAKFIIHHLSFIIYKFMIHRSPYPDAEIPDVSLTEFVLEHAAVYGDKPALIDGPTGRVLTFAQLAEKVRRAAAGLAARGFGKGDVFAILSPNLPEYAVVFHAVASVGGVNTTLNPLYTAEEIAHQLKDAGAKFLVTVPPLLDKAREAAALAGIQEVFVFGSAEGATPFDDLLSDDEPPNVSINPREDLIVLPYSSGTTGLAKGVMLTHRNLVANLCQFIGMGFYRPDDSLLGVLPMFHIYGMVVILNQALRCGLTLVTMPRFELEPFLQLAEKHKVTFLHCVPPIVLGLTKQAVVDNYDLSSVRAVFSGAAPLGQELSDACRTKFKALMWQGYGLTETSPVALCTPPDNAKPGSAGVPAPNTEIRLVDAETGADISAPHERGEVWIRGPQVMKGYLNRPEATAHTVDQDGWLHSGDIGYADEDGHFFIVDRLKELIKYQGFQVPPAE